MRVIGRRVYAPVCLSKGVFLRLLIYVDMVSSLSDVRECANDRAKDPFDLFFVQ